MRKDGKENKAKCNYYIMPIAFAIANYRIVIYELDKVLAGEESELREFSLGSHESNYFSKLVVDKTFVTVASNRGSVVKLDFWRCE